ncbi:MFS transporter [Pinisolibacter sp.]|uniref:MFS transporter n=1 Tax=Pinisolibacter sp. TaxID=2172024 RepID=UPI002FDC9B07
MTKSVPRAGDTPGANELGLSRLLAFAFPALPVAAFQLPFVILVPKFYAENVGLSFIAVGAIITIVRLIDAFLDPFVGYYADHTRPRWGRRRTWFGLAAIPTTVGALFVFNPFPDIGTDHTLFWGAWFFVWSMMLSVGYTALSLSHLSWGAEISTSYYGRNRIFAAREVFAVIGTLVATALPFVMSRLGWHGDQPVLVALSIMVAIALPLLALITVFTVPEPPHVSHHHLNFVDGLKNLFKNEYFVRLLGAYALANMGNGVPATLLLYYVRDYVHGNEETQRFFLLLYFLFGVLSTPLWLWLAKRTSKHRAWSFAMLVACAGFVWSPFAGYDVLGDNAVWAFGIIMILAGMSVGADLMLPVSMQADVIDVDTARTGEQHTGFYFASWALANKIALSIALGIGFVLLGIVGYDKGNHHGDTLTPAQVHVVTNPPVEGAVAVTPPETVKNAPGKAKRKHSSKNNGESDKPVKQTPLATWTLVFLYCVVPIVLKLIAVRLVWNFPIGPAEQAQLRAQIEAHRRAEREEEEGRPA